MPPRKVSRSHGSLAKARCQNGEKAKSVRGSSQLGVRWNTLSRATSGAICGTNCTALAPLPITPTRCPASDTE